MGLLAGEYRQMPGLSAWLTGQGYDLNISTGSCLLEAEPMRFLGVYSAGSTGPYSPGIDYLAFNQYFTTTLGVGPGYFTDYYENNLAYYRRGNATCGQPSYFAGLLPSRTAAAAAAATLHPNPTAEAATLTLATPTPPGTVLMLLDGTGRRIWARNVAPGQTSLPIALPGQPAGLYLVQLLAPGTTPLTWKLTHEL